ncbi:hypothetical protein AJ80_09934 [Polytolypa hystricis UAMH7299]|uniref:Uncharacterized protein n=1 Tax=Polytolypa hystricis (strain UAMH7299) TaxID=1447883 RepID=A0A2B7WFT4_POLH7|nr:hypothetical protein AJ80_09934 [Polytolypa hystricis UAMH7299]
MFTKTPPVSSPPRRELSPGSPPDAIEMPASSSLNENREPDLTSVDESTPEYSKAAEAGDRESAEEMIIEEGNNDSLNCGAITREQQHAPSNSPASTIECNTDVPPEELYRTLQQVSLQLDGSSVPVSSGEHQGDHKEGEGKSSGPPPYDPLWDGSGKDTDPTFSNVIERDDWTLNIRTLRNMYKVGREKSIRSDMSNQSVMTRSLRDATCFSKFLISLRRRGVSNPYPTHTKLQIQHPNPNHAAVKDQFWFTGGCSSQKFACLGIYLLDVLSMSTVSILNDDDNPSFAIRSSKLEMFWASLGRHHQDLHGQCTAIRYQGCSTTWQDSPYKPTPPTDLSSPCVLGGYYGSIPHNSTARAQFFQGKLLPSESLISRLDEN